MENRDRFIRVEEVMELLQIGQTTAYKIIRDLNNELKKKGYIVVMGRVPRKYFEERIYM